MVNVIRKEYEPVPNWLNLGLAVLLFISPWVFGFNTDTVPAVDAWAIAIIIGVFAVAALLKFQEWEEWVNVVAGGWLIISPWVLGFARDVPYATWTNVVLGIAAVVLASWSLLVSHEVQPRVKA